MCPSPTSPQTSPVWLEVTVTVDAPWAELVAETLGVSPCSTAEVTSSVVIDDASRSSPDAGSPAVGAHSSEGVEPATPGPHGTNPAEAVRRAHDASPRRTVRAWVEGTQDDETLRQQIHERLAALAPILGTDAADDLVPRFTLLDAHASSVFAGRPWRAFRVGRVCIGPPEDAHAVRPGDTFLALLPGQAFGTGRHATTRQCLAALQAQLRPGQRVLDAGCGTGLLGVAAACLGASAVTLLDFDPIAVACARRLAETQRVAERCTCVVDDAAQVPAGPWDGILANLEPGLARRFAEAYARALLPGGWLVASGCPRADADGLREALLAAGLVPTRLRETPRWCTWTAIRPTDSPALTP